ncbi:hypothetical protein [Hymenobacter psoromatis]|uniref:hypothetical protein n=1 Tax=Hymenobacter psoromatis TaxID=1484116 RepID=UPI001CC06F6E|nr:hypothetical protein [Hymenobacter psoromatis]
MVPPTPRPGSRSAKAGPTPLAQQQARAADRYHAQLRFSGLGPGIRGYVARQDGHLAEQAHLGARTMRHYELCLTNARTRQAQWARQLRQPAQPTAVIRQGEHRSPGEIQARQRQIALAKAHDKYVENVELISGEFTPLTLYDPVIRSTAEAGLLTMSGVAVGGVVAGLPSGLRWAGAGLEAGTGMRASYAALRTAPKAFAWQAGTRIFVDGVGQYGANVAFGNGWGGSLGEINAIESIMVGANINPYTTTIGLSAFSFSYNHGYQSVLYADNNPRTITTAKFLAQAGTGLLLTRGGKYLEKMTENSYLSWKLYQGAMHVGTPRVALPLLDTGVRFGQTYGIPLTNSIIGAFGFSATGMAADSLAPNQAVPMPMHPDSPVFIK